MKALIQRVSSAQITIKHQLYSQINQGLLIFLGICQSDNRTHLDWLVKKIIGLRIFSDSHGKMNLSIQDITGQILVVSQFTLCADCTKGNRPSFTAAAHPNTAEPLYNLFIAKLKEQGIVVKTGQFGAMMQIKLVNDGPVTIDLEKS